MEKLKSMIDVYFEIGMFVKVEIFKDIKCLICDTSLKDNNNAVKTKCKHYFHSNCLDKWFDFIYKKESTCHICPDCGINL